MTPVGAVIGTALAVVAAGVLPAVAVPANASSSVAMYSPAIGSIGARDASATATALRAATAHSSSAAVDGTTRTLAVAAVASLGDGDEAVRLQQSVQGVPVYAGELVVQLDADGSVLSVGGETSDRIGALSWQVGPEAARATALRTARGRADARAVALTVSEAARYVYDPALVGEPGARVRPVWQVLVTGPPASGVVVEVLVDASTGRVALVLDRTQRLSRTICDNENSTSTNIAAGSWCTRGDYNGNFLTTIDASRPQALKAYEDLGDTSDFFADVLGVDLTRLVGLDTQRPYSQRATPDLTATVNYCEPGERCPYANAFWIDADPRFLPRPGATYPGGQVFLGAGLADAEDVVAHEVVHGVTSAVNGLKYVNQSGAINESMSDVFGQLSQLWDHDSGRFVDARDPRWLVGEDLDVPGLRGAVRSMSNPSTTALPAGYPQPNRMTSRYWERTGADNGGVHTNSGVGNKTAYLMAKGGRFNGVTVKAIGPLRTARIYWRTQRLLTSGASYRDLAVTLAQSCSALYGVRSSTCVAVRASTAATQISKSRITVSASSWKLRKGGKRTLKARVKDFRGGAVVIRSNQKVTLVLERRWKGAKKWKRLSARAMSATGRTTWRVGPSRTAVYRVRHLGSRTNGLRTAVSPARTLTVRR